MEPNMPASLTSISSFCSMHPLAQAIFLRSPPPDVCRADLIRVIIQLSLSNREQLLRMPDVISSLRQIIPNLPKAEKASLLSIITDIKLETINNELDIQQRRAFLHQMLPGNVILSTSCSLSHVQPFDLEHWDDDITSDHLVMRHRYPNERLARCLVKPEPFQLEVGEMMHSFGDVAATSLFAQLELKDYLEGWLRKVALAVATLTDASSKSAWLQRRYPHVARLYHTLRRRVHTEDANKLITRSLNVVSSGKTHTTFESIEMPSAFIDELESTSSELDSDSDEDVDICNPEQSLFVVSSATIRIRLLCGGALSVTRVIPRTKKMSELFRTVRVQSQGTAVQELMSTKPVLTRLPSDDVATVDASAFVTAPVLDTSDIYYELFVPALGLRIGPRLRNDACERASAIMSPEEYAVFARTRRTGFAHRSLSSDFALWIGLDGPSVAGSKNSTMLSLVRLLAFIAWERVGSLVETALEVHRQRRSAVKPLCRFDIEIAIQLLRPLFSMDP